jgi:hypothetical protein
MRTSLLDDISDATRRSACAAGGTPCRGDAPSDPSPSCEACHMIDFLSLPSEDPDEDDLLEDEDFDEDSDKDDDEDDEDEEDEEDDEEEETWQVSVPIDGLTS